MRALAIIGIAVVASVRGAAADPALDHVVDAPTAWLPHAGVVIAQASIDRFRDGSILLGYGLGGVSSVELGVDSDVHSCTSPPCTGTSSPVYQGRAAFRLGVSSDRWFVGQPALVLGMQTTLHGNTGAATAYLVASRTLAFIRLHAGVAALDAIGDGMRMGAVVRPLGGIEVTPPKFPQSTMMADIEWVPELSPTSRPVATWLAGGGVRYQALRWGSIELLVRVQQGEGLGNSSVLVRVNAIWGR